VHSIISRQCSDDGLADQVSFGLLSRKGFSAFNNIGDFSPRAEVPLSKSGHRCYQILFRHLKETFKFPPRFIGDFMVTMCEL